MKRFLVIILFCNVATIGVTQSNQLTFQYLGEEQGLTGGLINAIQKDDLGFLWVATREGLFRYDGHQFEQFKGYGNGEQTRTLHDVRGLQKDKKGQLWIGSSQGWLTVINPRTNILKSYQLPEDEIKTNTIWNISIDSKGHIWFAFERGLGYFNPNTEAFKTWQSHQFFNIPKGSRYSATYAVMVDNQNDNKIWIGTRGGHFFYDVDKDEFHQLPLPENPNDHIKVKRFAINYEQNDSLLFLFGNNMSLMSFHKEKQTWQCLYEKANAKGDPRFFFKDNNTFWLGTTDEGLGKIHFNKSLLEEEYYTHNSLEQLSLKKGFIEHIYKDRKGVFWIGVENGICVLSPSLQDFKHYYPKFKENANNFEQFTGAYFQAENDSLFYFVSRYNGAFHILNRNTGEEERITHQDLLPNSDLQVIWEITGDKSGQIWVATNCGIYLYDKKNKKLTTSTWDKDKILPTQNSEQCFTDKEGNVWCIGNFINVVKIDVSKERVEIFNCSKESTNGYPKLEGLFDFKISKDGYWWLSDAYQVVRFNPETKDLLILNAVTGEDKLSANRIIDLWVSDNKNLWVYYKYNGIDKVDFSKLEGERVTHLDLKDGLSSNKIYRIVTDNRRQAWLATGNGLSNFNLKTQRFKNYRTPNGLITNNLHKGWHTSMDVLSTGEIVLGGKGYFTIFHPDSLIEETKQPALVFNGLKIFDQSRFTKTHLNFLKKLNLSYLENYFTVTFTDVNFPYEQSPVFQYRLKGYDRKWRTTTIGKAEYTNIGGGNYKLEIRVIDENGLQVGEKKTLNINISFPFWQTWWFILLSVATVACTIFGLYNYRVRQVIEKEQLKTEFNRKIVEAEMTALRAQMNPHFMFNSLNSIKNYIIKNEARIAARYLTKFAKLMRMILNNSERDTMPISEELNALKLYMELEQLRFNDKFDFIIEQDEKTGVQHFLIPPLILQPYVENAIWHGLMHKTDGIGKITIKVFKEKEIIHISIFDNGIGRVKALEIKSKFTGNHKSIGLKITKERLDMFSNKTGHSTNLYVEDLMNEKGHATGTCVHLEINTKNYF